MFLSYKEHNKGFTLAEIVIVVIIVGVLATLAIPRFRIAVERVKTAEGVQLLTALLGAQKAYALENNGNYSVDPTLLDIEILIASNFVVPPTVLNPSPAGTNPIATIQRTGNYTLRIDQFGTITCANGGAPFTCVQVGY